MAYYKTANSLSISGFASSPTPKFHRAMQQAQMGSTHALGGITDEEPGVKRLRFWSNEQTIQYPHPGKQAVKCWAHWSPCPTDTAQYQEIGKPCFKDPHQERAGMFRVDGEVSLPTDTFAFPKCS